MEGVDFFKGSAVATTVCDINGTVRTNSRKKQCAVDTLFL